ncbi:MAG: hypothetical protein J2P41_02850, partial [Blastocatellia bacterium]|nr:hypothetical protein [Blastocatellia bacterium]
GMEVEMETNWRAIVDAVLDEVLELPNANPSVGVAWVERRVSQKELDRCATRLAAMTSRNEIWQRASIAFLESLGKAGEKQRLRDFVARNRESLRGNTQTWGNVGYSLYSIGDIDAAIDWLSDWQNRREVEPWMLWNLSLACRDRRRDRQSYEISVQALNLPADDLTQAHALLVSFDEMLRDDWDKARERVEKINEPTLRDWDRNLWQIVGVLHNFFKEKIAGLDRHVDTIDRLLSLVRETNYFEGSGLLLSLCRRAILRVARDRKNGWLLAITYGRLFWLSFLSSLRRV